MAGWLVAFPCPRDLMMLIGTQVLLRYLLGAAYSLYLQTIHRDDAVQRRSEPPIPCGWYRCWDTIHETGIDLSSADASPWQWLLISYWCYCSHDSVLSLPVWSPTVGMMHGDSPRLHDGSLSTFPSTRFTWTGIQHWLNICVYLRGMAG